MRGNAAFAYFAGIGARGVEEGASGAAGAVDDVFGEELEVVCVVGIFVADDVDEPSPAAAQADDLVAFADGANGDGADCGVEAGDIAAAGQDS